MAKRMLIDAAHPEETRVVVLNGNRLEEFDFETSTKKQIKGNIYLAKITRVEPSLQAAFVEYGGNRHGFLAFNEIHPDYYRIPVADRQAALAAERAAEEAADAREEAEHDEAEFRRDEPPSAVGTDGIESPLPFAETGDEEPPPGRMAHAAPAEVIRSADRDTGEAETPFAASHDHGHDHDHDHDHDDDDDRGHEQGGLFARSWDEPADSFPSAAQGEEPGEARSAWPTGSEAPAGAQEASYGAGSQPSYDGGETSSEGGLDHDDPHRGSYQETSGEAVTEALRVERGDEPSLPGEAVEGDSIEIVGGDEMEEATRPRLRPARHYKIQEVIKRRQIMLVQVTKEERGNKGAALTTYLSLAGRYCVLMPNTPRGGGVSRKITNNVDRRRLKELVSDLDMPEGMGVIVRTAGSERSKAEIKRDFEYLLRLWDEIRELTLRSTAPALIYEEGNLIKRSIRDLYARDLEEVVVDGEEGYRTAKAFMKMLMPSHTKRVKPYRDPTVPLFHRFQVDSQIDAIHSPIVQLRSGGYIVINPTEALVAIDVNSGRSTRERNIEETAFKTNVEAAEEIARQLRLRDLAGLIVIDYIDMEEHRNQATVERRLKEAMRHDRARIQIGRISPFGLLELSRQRLRPSLLEASTQPCPHCAGTGHIRSTESTALHVLRAIEEEGVRRRSAEISVAVPTAVALYILNQKRTALIQAEGHYGFKVTVTRDDTLVPPAFRLDRVRALTPAEIAALPVAVPPPPEADADEDDDDFLEEEDEATAEAETAGHSAAEADAPADGDGEAEAPRHSDAGTAEDQGPSRRRRRQRRRPGEEGRTPQPMPFAADELPTEPEAGEMPAPVEDGGEAAAAEAPAEPRSEEEGEADRKQRRRRGRRGGRRRHRNDGGPEEGAEPESEQAPEAETVEYVPPLGEEHETIVEITEVFAFEATSFPDAMASESVPIGEEGDSVRERAEPQWESEETAVAPEAAPLAAELAAAPSEPPPSEPAPSEPAPAEPPLSELAAESERLPIQHNVPPTHEVSGPPANPRRGWWRR